MTAMAATRRTHECGCITTALAIIGVLYLLGLLT